MMKTQLEHLLWPPYQDYKTRQGHKTKKGPQGPYDQPGHKTRRDHTTHKSHEIHQSHKTYSQCAHCEVSLDTLGKKLKDPEKCLIGFKVLRYEG